MKATRTGRGLILASLVLLGASGCQMFYESVSRALPNNTYQNESQGYFPEQAQRYDTLRDPADRPRVPR